MVVIIPKEDIKKIRARNATTMMARAIVAVVGKNDEGVLNPRVTVVVSSCLGAHSELSYFISSNHLHSSSRPFIVPT